jgi:hypothetical protein
MLKQFCEVHSTPDPVFASSNVVYIELNSNPMLSGSQFLLEWTAQYVPDLTNGTSSGIIKCASKIFAKILLQDAEEGSTCQSMAPLTF